MKGERFLGDFFGVACPRWGPSLIEEVVDPLTHRDHMHHEDAWGVPALLLRLDGPGRRYVTERGKVTGVS